jgi:hypothetical protein
LLPGESLAFRLSVFVLCLLMAGFCGWLGFALYQQSINLPEGLNDPFKAFFIAVILPFAGLVMLFRRTPRHTRYANRAERHVSLNPRQATADYTQALEFAPVKEQAGLLRKRAAVYEKLGQAEDATRDLIAITYAEDAYQTGASFVRLIGGDGDTYSQGRAKDERSNLVKSGRAVVIGYCPVCKDAVQLNGDMRCNDHPRSKPKRVRMVVPSDLADARKEILSGKKRRTPGSQRDRFFRLAILLTALVTGYLLIKAYIINPINTANEIPESQPGIVEVVPTATLEFVTSSDQGEQPSELPETPTAESEPPGWVAGQVKGYSINVRAGPGTSYAIVGRLAGNSEIQAAGRNATGDWLKIVEPPGWVSLDLVTLPVQVDTLPVIGN